MIPCEICQEEGGIITCGDVGPVCFDCWGSGIHETMKRKASESLAENLEDFLKHALRSLWLAICEGNFGEVAPKYGISPMARVPRRYWEVAS